ncbi:MAG: hypothetical protein NC930_07975, partial [Candidatus Omnitrophica bacterium]|nr:hypothetical protein [Candidatus Omnitrophota bacterium]
MAKVVLDAEDATSVPAHLTNMRYRNHDRNYIRLLLIYRSYVKRLIASSNTYDQFGERNDQGEIHNRIAEAIVHILIREGILPVRASQLVLEDHTFYRLKPDLRAMLEMRDSLSRWVDAETLAAELDPQLTQVERARAIASQLRQNALTNESAYLLTLMRPSERRDLLDQINVGQIESEVNREAIAREVDRTGEFFGIRRQAEIERRFQKEVIKKIRDKMEEQMIGMLNPIGLDARLEEFRGIGFGKVVDLGNEITRLVKSVLGEEIVAAATSMGEKHTTIEDRELSERKRRENYVKEVFHSIFQAATGTMFVRQHGIPLREDETFFPLWVFPWTDSEGRSVMTEAPWDPEAGFRSYEKPQVYREVEKWFEKYRGPNWRTPENFRDFLEQQRGTDQFGRIRDYEHLHNYLKRRFHNFFSQLKELYPEFVYPDLDDFAILEIIYNYQQNKVHPSTILDPMERTLDWLDRGGTIPQARVMTKLKTQFYYLTVLLNEGDGKKSMQELEQALEDIKIQSESDLKKKVEALRKESKQQLDRNSAELSADSKRKLQEEVSIQLENDIASATERSKEELNEKLRTKIEDECRKLMAKLDQKGIPFSEDDWSARFDSFLTKYQTVMIEPGDTNGWLLFDDPTMRNLLTQVPGDRRLDLARVVFEILDGEFDIDVRRRIKYRATIKAQESMQPQGKGVMEPQEIFYYLALKAPSRADRVPDILEIAGLSQSEISRFLRKIEPSMPIKEEVDRVASSIILERVGSNWRNREAIVHEKLLTALGKMGYETSNLTKGIPVRSPIAMLQGASFLDANNFFKTVAFITGSDLVIDHDHHLAFSSDFQVLSVPVQEKDWAELGLTRQAELMEGTLNHREIIDRILDIQRRKSAPDMLIASEPDDEGGKYYVIRIPNPALWERIRVRNDKDQLTSGRLTVEEITEIIRKTYQIPEDEWHIVPEKIQILSIQDKLFASPLEEDDTSDLWQIGALAALGALGYGIARLLNQKDGNVKDGDTCTARAEVRAGESEVGSAGKEYRQPKNWWGFFSFVFTVLITVALLFIFSDISGIHHLFSLKILKTALYLIVCASLLYSTYFKFKFGKTREKKTTRNWLDYAQDMLSQWGLRANQSKFVKVVLLMSIVLMFMLQAPSPLAFLAGIFHIPGWWMILTLPTTYFILKYFPPLIGKGVFPKRRLPASANIILAIVINVFPLLWIPGLNVTLFTVTWYFFTWGAAYLVFCLFVKKGYRLSVLLLGLTFLGLHVTFPWGSYSWFLLPLLFVLVSPYRGISKIGRNWLFIATLGAAVWFGLYFSLVKPAGFLLFFMFI